MDTCFMPGKDGKEPRSEEVGLGDIGICKPVAGQTWEFTRDLGVSHEQAEQSRVQYQCKESTR